MQRADRVDATAGQRLLRAYDKRRSRGVGPERVERLTRSDADAAALSRREPPDAVVTAERTPGLVDDRPRGRDAVTLEERAIVVAGEEARFLALRASRRLEAGCSRLGTRGGLPLRAERKVDALESGRGDGGEHVRLILGGVGSSGDEPERRPVRRCGRNGRSRAAPPHALCEASSAAKRNVPLQRTQGFGVRPRAYAPTNGSTTAPRNSSRRSSVPWGSPRAWHARVPRDRSGRAARALRARPAGVEPESKGDADGGGRGAKQRNGAVDAAAHRHGDATRPRRRLEDLGECVRERVDGEGLARDGGGFEQRQPVEGAVQTGCLGLDDPIAVDDQANACPLAPAGGVAEDLDVLMRSS